MGIAWSGFKSVWSCIKYVLNFLYQAYLHFQTASDLFQKMLPMPTPKLPDISVDQYSLNSGQTYSKDDCINMFSSKFQLSNIYQNWVGKCCLDEPQIYCNCFEDENTRQLVLSSCPYLLEKKFDSTCFHITNHTKNQYKITNPILPESDNNVLITNIEFK
uniref:Uncharacterized protein LOC113789904 n=1 Tax=Dermatophagoides pteronyssinus TaxID=6956 RepID=A0A6P6XPB0_DERPT|nr:uncharacterized protein LOC113789904 [Dermatophagoides pteronyssinus]